MLNAKFGRIVITTLSAHQGISVVNVVNGEKLAQLRQKREWGQRELAAAAKVDPSVISRLERNLQEDCMLSIVVAIAEALGVMVDDLLMNGQQATNARLHPELQAAINRLTQQPVRNQRQAAGILEGYLLALDRIND